MLFRASLCVLALASPVALVSPAVFAASASAPDLDAMLTQKAPAYVTVRFLLKMGSEEMGMGDQEMEATGVMIDPAGLVLLSNSEMGGMMARFARMQGGGAAPQPSEIKVLVGDDTTGVEARLVARDSELDLAWVQVNTPPSAPYAHLDLSAAGEAKVGDTLVTISRKGKFFDRAAIIETLSVTGRTTKPRDLFFSSSLNPSMGLPVFDLEGRFVGVQMVAMPDDDEMMSMMGSGNMNAMRDAMSPAILPASLVIEATQRAREAAAKPVEQPAEQPADAAPAPAPAGAP